MGLTEKIESSFQKSGKKVSGYYADIRTMKEFNISPFEWQKMHRWDKLVLSYQSLLESYYEKEAIDNVTKKVKKEQELEKKKADIKKDLPKVNSRERRSSNGSSGTI